MKNDFKLNTDERGEKGHSEESLRTGCSNDERYICPELFRRGFLETVNAAAAVCGKQ